MTAWEELASKTAGQLKNAGVKSVFGEPYEQDGKKIVPVAKVSYGWGGGEGKTEKPENEGEEGGGIGAGVTAKPYGFIVIENEKVSYRPVFELAHVLMGATLFVLVWRFLFSGNGRRSG
jgi:uncharacterized spore protein YtfJ